MKIRSRPRRISRCLCALACSLPGLAAAQIPGESVNMVSGTQWPGGDPFLQRQNEPSIAVSSANPRHLLAGANDYRTVDLPNPGAPDETGDAWLGVFKSFDGGQTWQSVLLPGYPQDASSAGLASPLHGFRGASDPVVRAGTSGMFYFSGITFDRGTNRGRVFVARFLDLNDKENGDATRARDPIQWVDARPIETGTAGQFLDKPWIAADVPRAGAATCTIPTSPSRSFAGGAVYLAYAVFTGNSTSPSSKIMFTRSDDCGRTWATPQKLSESNNINQGTVVAVDPLGGAVYVAWRRFATSSRGDAILLARSTDLGKTFGKAQVVADLANPFDQDTPPGTLRFRSEAFPTLAVSVDGAGKSRVHLAWSQRPSAGADARIAMTTSTDGIVWSAPAAVDPVPLQDDFGDPFGRGHQLMPQLAFSQGSLMLLYYDTRLDHTLGTFAPNAPFFPDDQGRFYREERAPVGELIANPGAVFTPFIDDAGLGQVRHTMDVRVGQAAPGPSPAFHTVRVTNFLFGERGDEVPGLQIQGFRGSIAIADSSALLRLQQLQFNPPDLKLFAQGTAAFMGDYIDIAGSVFVPTAGGGWAFDTAPGRAPVFHAVWTSNQDVRPPADGDWTHYTPVGGGTASFFDPTQTTPACLTGQEGMRNQNIYTSRITTGLAVSSPQNAKPLSGGDPPLKRAFVVVAQNGTPFDLSVRFSAAAPPGVSASFRKDGTSLPSFDVTIPAHSAVARSLFAYLTTSTDPAATIAVNVDEVDPASPAGCLGAIPPTCALARPGLSGSVTLNPPGSNPSLLQPDCELSAPLCREDITAIEFYAPRIGGAVTNLSNTNLSNTNLSNTNLTNTNLSNTNLSNESETAAHVSNAGVTNLSNTNLTNTNYTNTNLSNTNLSNTNLSNAAVSDASYVVTNTGNTTHSYHVRIVGSPPATPLQLILAKNYTTPLGLNCNLVEEPRPAILASIGDIRPAMVPPGTPLADPNIPDPSPTNATFSLSPGESAIIALRGVFTKDQMQELATQLAPAVVPHAGGEFAAALLVASDGASLPVPRVGVPYAAALQAIGGTAPYAWALVAGSLPAGLALAGGQIAGIPVQTGTSSFTLQVTDQAAPANVSQRSISLTVRPGPTTTTLAVSPAAPAYGQAVTLTATVRPAASGPGVPVPGGAVSFGDGGAALGTAALSGGSATLVIPAPGLPPLSVGSHSLTAAYGGDGNYEPSATGASLMLTVAPLYRFNGFLSPLAAAGSLSSPTDSGTQSYGSAVPIKWQLQDAAGAYVTRLGSAQLLQAVLNPACAGPPPAGATAVLLYSPTSGATGGSTFRYDPSNNQFIFNWDTSSAPARGCYDIVLQLDDGTQKATILRLG